MAAIVGPEIIDTRTPTRGAKCGLDLSATIRASFVRSPVRPAKHGLLTVRQICQRHEGAGVQGYTPISPILRVKEHDPAARQVDIGPVEIKCL